MVCGRPSAQAESGFVSVLPFCAPRSRTDAEAVSRAVASAPKCRRRNAHAEMPMPKCPCRNAHAEMPPVRDGRRLLWVSLFFQEQIKGPGNAPIARFDGFRCYQSRSEIKRWLRRRIGGKDGFAGRL